MADKSLFDIAKELYQGFGNNPSNRELANTLTFRAPVVRELNPLVTIPRGIETLRNTDYGAIKDLLLGKYQIADNPKASLQRAGQALMNVGEGALDAAPVLGLVKPTIAGAKMAAPHLAEAGVRKLVNLEEKYGLPTSPMMNIIKPEGGNWINDNGYFGGVNKLVEGLHQPFDTREETKKVLEKYGITLKYLLEIPEKERAKLYTEFLSPENKNAIAHNQWVDSTLKKYVKQRMGTESDEIRKLADEGVTHFKPAGSEGGIGLPYSVREGEDLNTAENLLATRRKRYHYDPQGAGKSANARSWEATTDMTILPTDVADVLNTTYSEAEPWMHKVDPSTTVHTLLTTHPGTFGFDKISATVKDALASGELRAENLNRLSLEDAAKMTHEKRVAKELESGEAARKELAGMTQVKKYGDGTTIVKLDKPGQFAKESDQMNNSVRGYEPPENHPDWVEGAKGGTSWYGHGGWEAIKNGEAEVYAVKDANGKSIANIEVANQATRDIDNIPDEVQSRLMDRAEEEASDRLSDLYDPSEVSQDPDRYYQELHELQYEMYHDLAYDWLDENAGEGMRITQIKGRGNGRVDEKGLKAVQDFVRSKPWTSIKELDMAQMLKLPDGRVVTYEELEKPLAKFKQDSGLENMTPEKLQSHLEHFGDRVWPNMEKYFEGIGVVPGKAPESHPFIGYMTKDGKMERFNETQAKEADYHHSNLVKDLDAYDSDDSLKFVRNGSENVYTIRGNAAIMPHATESKQQLSTLAKQLVDAGADPSAPFQIEHMSLPETEAPYQGKSIGTLKDWIEGTHGFAVGGLVSADYDDEHVDKLSDALMQGEYGLRETGEPKTRGALGEIRMPNGRDVMTEYSINPGGRGEIPSIVEGMHPADVNYLRYYAENPTEDFPAGVEAVAIRSAKRRKAEGKPAFYGKGGEVKDPFADLSVLDKAALLAKAAKYRIQYNKQAEEHGKYPDILSSALKDKYREQVGNSRVNRSPLDAAINYGGGYDFGVRNDVPANVARDMAKAYQYTDYFFSPFTGPKSDAVGDYYENMAGVEAGIKERSRRASEEDIARRSADYGRRTSKMLPQNVEENYAKGGLVYNDEEINNLANQLFGA